MSTIQTIEFKSIALCNEIHLNTLANHFGIRKRFEWEDFLKLKEPQLRGVLKEPEGKAIHIFPFGSVVFVNMQHHEMVDAITYLAGFEKNLKDVTFDYKDEYSLEVKPNEEIEMTNDAMIVNEFSNFQSDILSVVLAKSVSLERIEADIETLLDEIEDVIKRLQKGNLSSKEDQLSKIAAKILGFKYNMISYIMLLDKPDSTWNNERAEELYNQLSHMFELDERYNKIQAKAETLMDIVQVFTSLTQHRKSNILEIMIIALIMFEICITMAEHLFGF